ncbi:MAG TPA: hypothetical protein VGP79_18890 [Bryobacteraceae bacterium]|jgi:uncharacterized protein (TIGR03437 family)|nr:hypothetical protein [Bryobacteraceae bacterium]
MPARSFLLILCICVVLSFNAAGQQNCRSQVIAGIPSTFGGDGGPATSAFLAYPSGLNFDSSGNLYIADTYNHRIRMVGKDGKIVTIAGNGVAARTGDGGSATVASLKTPEDVLPLTGGGFLIADTGNNQIRRVSSDGTITTLAGTGHPGFDGDGGNASRAELNGPTALAVDAKGVIFFADTNNHVIRRIGLDNVISTVAGKTHARVIAPAGGNSQPCCYGGDGGPATKALLNSPRGVAVGGDGTIYVADNGNNVIREVSAAGAIRTIAGNPASHSRPLPSPATETAIAVSSNLVLMPDQSIVFEGAAEMLQLSPDRSTLLRFAGLQAFGHVPSIALAPEGTVYAVQGYSIAPVVQSGEGTAVAGRYYFGSPAIGAPALGVLFRGPLGSAVGRDGSLYVADYGNNVVRKIRPDGIQTTIGVAAPLSVALDAAENLYVLLTRTVVKISPGSTTPLTVAGGGNGPLPGMGVEVTATSINLMSTQGLAVDSKGVVYIFTTRLGGGPGIGLRVSPEGKLTTIFDFNGSLTQSLLPGFAGMAVDAQDNLLVGAPQSIFRFGPNAGGIPLPANFRVASVAGGPSGRIFVGSTDGRISELLAGGGVGSVSNGDFSEFLGFGISGVVPFGQPVLILSQDANGDLYVADRDLHRVRKIFTSACRPAAQPVIASLPNPKEIFFPDYAPGEIVEIFGAGLGPNAGVGPVLGADRRVPTILGGTRVLFDGIPGRVLYTSKGQVNAIIPFDLYGRQQTRVQVEFNGVLSDAFVVSMTDTAPLPFYYYDSTIRRSSPVVVNEDGKLNSLDNPARGGSVVTLYMTGFGRTTPEGTDGGLAGVTLPQVRAQVSATLSTLPCEVQYAGASLDLVEGAIQINVKLPNVGSGGNLVITAGESSISVRVEVK